MKITKSKIKQIAENGNKIVKYVCNDILDNWEEYDSPEYYINDVLQYGCISGIVDSLIYYKDTIMFYDLYKEDINTYLQEYCEDTGIYNMCELFGERWDKYDPLALERENQNLLAWFGYEEAMRYIANNLDMEE